MEIHLEIAKSKEAVPMSLLPTRPFNITEAQLFRVCTTHSAVFPELEAARLQSKALLQAPQTQVVLAYTKKTMNDIEHIPQTTYTMYHAFQRSGERGQYETPYFLKRTLLAAATLRLFFGQTDLKDKVQDYLWNICEETNWVLPAHEEKVGIDLFAAETGFVLAETLLLLGETLDSEVRQRVQQEIEKRIFAPYLRSYASYWWYTTNQNWNGVCNSAIAATFLLLEAQPERAVQALTIALQGLQVFVERAFEDDGSSSEGVSYWEYGLMNFVALSEFLYARSQGEINLLASARLRQIAAYPAQVQLHGSQFASFSDCDESAKFNPGIVVRLAQRTQEPSLNNLLAQPAKPGMDWRLTMMLRNILWWDGVQPAAVQVHDAWLKTAGIVRLVTENSGHERIVLIVKAGNNGEHHNHNDVGSFILNVAGENLLVDPGRGLYSRAYFSEQRYENIFASSYGHGVPLINGMLQATGEMYAGHIEQVNIQESHKLVKLECAKAYPVPELLSALRRLILSTDGSEAGTVWLRDTFIFSKTPAKIEEVFITWQACTIEGSTARIHGREYDLLLTIEHPQNVQFALKHLEKESMANKKADVLKRLCITLPGAIEVRTSVRIQIMRSQK